VNEGWLEGEITGSAEQRWMPVYRAVCAGHQHVLGVTPSGSYVEGAKGTVALSESTGVRFLFLLEHPLDEVRSAVRTALAAAGLQDVPLPLSVIVAAALRGKMEYWASLAASWLEQDGEQYPELQDLIADAVASAWASQRTRHRLRRFLRR
jgi:hypothetical protein